MTGTKLSLQQHLSDFQTIVNGSHGLQHLAQQITHFVQDLLHAKSAALYLKMSDAQPLKQIYCNQPCDIRPMPNTQVGEMVFYEDQLLIPLASGNEIFGCIILKEADNKDIVSAHFELTEICLLASLKLFGLIQTHHLQLKTRVINEYLLSYQTDASGQITEVSDALVKQLGIEKQKVIGEAAKQVFKYSDPVHELKLSTHEGQDIWLKATAISSVNFLGEKQGELHLHENITQLKHAEALSITDELSGLYNRRLFNEVFPKEIENAQRHKDTVAFMILDIDNFKSYNDTYGHLAGDQVIQAVSKALMRCYKREGDYVFRLGGEEFCVLCHVTHEDDAEVLANIARESIKALNIEHTGNPHKVVTISTGLIVINNTQLGDDTELYNLADQALYQAKKSGKNLVINCGSCGDDIELF